MNCESVQESLVALLDGEVGESERDALAAHLAGCPACRRERELLRETRALVADHLRRPAATGGAFDALWQRVEAEDATAARRVVPFPAGGADTAPGRRSGRAPRTTAAWAVAGGFAAAAGLALALLGVSRDEGASPAGAPPARLAEAPEAAPAPLAVAKAPARRAPGRASKEPAPAVVARAPRAAPAPRPDGGAGDPTAVALGEADPPRDLLERPELFVNYSIVRKLDELRHLDAVLAESPADGKQGGAG